MTSTYGKEPKNDHSVMDKVLFLLCIPEENEKTDTVTKNKHDESKNDEKPMLQEQEGKDKAISGTAEDDSEAKEENGVDRPKFTLSDLKLKSEERQKEAGENGALPDAFSVKPSQNEKDTGSSEETTTSIIPMQTVASPAKNEPKEACEKQENVPDPSSVATLENASSVPGITENESQKHGKESAGDDPDDAAQSSQPASLTHDTDQDYDGVSETPGTSGLITKDMLGQSITDDFWDFDVEKESTDLSNCIDAGDREEELQQEQALENAEVKQKQTTKEEDSPQNPHGQSDSEFKASAPKVEADSQDVFHTCPNTPASSKKNEDKVLSNDVNAHPQQSAPNKKNTALCDDSMKDCGLSSNIHTSKSEPAIIDVESKMIPDKSPQKEKATLEESSELDKAGDSATHQVKKKLNSDKFLTTPVADNVGPGKDSVDLVKPIFKSASTGEMLKMKGGSTMTQPAETDDTEKTKAVQLGRKFSLDSKEKMLQIKLPESSDVDENTELMDFLPKLSLRTLVRNCLDEEGVKNVAWQKCTGDRVWQVTFVEDSGMRCEDIMLKLATIGVGRAHNSSISVIPVSIHAEILPGEEVESKADSTEQDSREEEAVQQMEEKATEFQKSIKSRLVVRQVVKSVESNAGFTFDYLILVILASVIAAIGLVENSSVILVASMLISPLMGPILAGTFGTVIQDTALRNLGISSELRGLGICLLCGFLCGLIPSSLETGSTQWRSAEQWPTTEMCSRGVLRGLLIGMFIALPSGAGVALSVLGGNTGSLVGVAISASLLPPAVNAGMLWSAAVIALIVPEHLVMQTKTQNVTEIINGTEFTRLENISFPVIQRSDNGLLCPQIENNEYSHFYFCSRVADFAVLGTVSLFLTILNIFCIFIMGIIILKIKVVAPKTSTPLDQNFFKKDIKVVRQSYTTTKGPQSATMGKKWLEEYKALKKQMELDDVLEEADTIEFQHILQSVENSPEVQGVLSRMSSSQPRPMSAEMAPLFHEAAFHQLEKHPDLERVYHTLAYPTSAKSPVSNTKMQNIYHTIRSPWNLFPNPQIPAFWFPSTYSLRPESVPSTPKFFTPTRLAPISENEVAEDDRKLHLHMPKNFHVTRLVEKPGEERDGKKQASGGLAGGQRAKDAKAPKRKAFGKKGRKFLYPKRSSKRAAAPQATELAEVSIEAPLLGGGSSNADTEESDKSARV